MMNNLNMNRNTISERGVIKPTVGASTKRRALGDITNAVADDESRNNVINKKPIVSLSVNNLNSDEQHVNMHVDREYMQRVTDDIDGRDVDNPLLVTCYVNEMYDYFNQIEQEFRVNCNYMAKQDFVNEKMRAILADWLVSVYIVIFFHAHYHFNDIGQHFIG